MNNKKLFSLAIILLITIVMINSCEKDTNEISPLVNIPKIKTEHWSGYTYPTLYTYDKDGRLIRMDLMKKDLTPYSYKIVEYIKDTVKIKSYDGKGILGKTRYFLINSNGLATSQIAVETSYDPFDYSTILTYFDYSISKVEYEYENNYLIGEKWNNSKTNTYSYAYINGNRSLKGSSSPEAYNDKLNTIGNHNFGISFLGSDSKNLQDKYNYVYDDQNRVIKRTAKIGSSYYTEYTYY